MGQSRLVLCAHLLSHVQLFETPWTIACHGPMSMEFSRQEYWRRLPFPPPGDLPDPGIKPGSPAGGLFTTAPPCVQKSHGPFHMPPPFWRLLERGRCFLTDSVVKNPPVNAGECRRCMGRGFNPWVGKIPWTRKWEPTPVFLFGEFHGQRSLVGCSP